MSQAEGHRLCWRTPKGLGELEALTRMGVPHRIGWGHTWLSLAGPELGVETKIREALSY